MLLRRIASVALSALSALSLAIAACGDAQPAAQLACGTGTIAAQGKCVPADAGLADDAHQLECGPGTTEHEGRCVALEAGVECGPHTSLRRGRCVQDDAGPGLACGEGTMAVDGECVLIESPACPDDAGCPPAPIVCDPIVEDPSATIQDFTSITGDPCLEQAAGTRYACFRYGNDYEIRSPTLLEAPAPGPARFLRLARVTGREGEYDHNSIAFDRTAVGAHALVVADFDFRITSRKGQRADGFGFALLNTAVYGTQGAVATDAAEEPNFRDSLGIGFDIFQNSDNADIGDHDIRPGFANTVSVHHGDTDPSPDDVPLAQHDFTAFGDLASGSWHHVRVSLRGAGADSLVSVAITTPCGEVVPVLANFSLRGVQPYEARAWFGARSGDEGSEYDIANVRVQFMGTGDSGVAFESREVLIAENAGEVELGLLRTGDASAPALISYSTADRGAKAGLDYATSCGQVAFAAGETHATIRVPISDDLADETAFDPASGFPELVPNPTAVFSVALGSADRHVRILGPAQAMVGIVDDESARKHGAWGDLRCAGIVPVHASLLPTGKVLYADRRSQVALWTADSGGLPIAGPGHNIFCSGAAFLGDGRLVIAGGHDDMHGSPDADGKGLPNLTAFDPTTETWHELAEMNTGRWYPTVTTLSDGTALVISGSYTSIDDIYQYDYLPQLFLPAATAQLGGYRDLSGAQAQAENEAAHGREFYPWMFALPAAKLFKAGPDNTTWTLDTAGLGEWIAGPTTLWEPVRDYGSAVLLGQLERKTVLILGGGDPPTRAVERLDLQALVALEEPEWELLAPLIAARRQQNATVLPDGRVVVTGGCAGEGFNDLDHAVTAGEIYERGQWSLLPAAMVPRGYHSFSLLLPDGSVLTGGGGEGGAVAVLQNNFQIYYPDYFYKPRPVIDAAPASVIVGTPFVVETTNIVSKVTLVRLGTPTHSFDENQRYLELPFANDSKGVSSVIAADGWTPPGDYLLFIVDADDVPSTGEFLRVGPALL